VADTEFGSGEIIKKCVEWKSKILNKIHITYTFSPEWGDLSNISPREYEYGFTIKSILKINIISDKSLINCFPELWKEILYLIIYYFNIIPT